MRNSTLPQGLMGFLIGLGVGAAVGILFAPKSGEEMREYLLDGANGAIDQVLDAGRGVRHRARQAVNDAATRVSNATDAGEAAFTKARGA